MLHKLFIPIFRYNNKRVAILGNIGLAKQNAIT